MGRQARRKRHTHEPSLIPQMETPSAYGIEKGSLGFKGQTVQPTAKREGKEVVVQASKGWGGGIEEASWERKCKAEMCIRARLRQLIPTKVRATVVNEASSC